MPATNARPIDRICLVYTGGTMGSKPSESNLLAPASLGEFESKVNELAAANSWPADLTFRQISDALIDSANAIPQDWLRVRQVLADEWANYDGFVVVHGTDTMPYVAAFLSFAIEFQNKPVVVTGSMKPIFEEGDAASNLEASVRVAVSRTTSGTPIDQVLICFGGRILRGNRATKLSLSDAGFDTPRVAKLGKYSSESRGIELDWEDGHPKKQVRPDAPTRFLPVRHSRLGIIRLFPGISTEMIRLMINDLDGMVIEAYGSGTGPEDVRRVLEACARRGKFIVVTTEVLDGEIRRGYETDLIQGGSHLISGGTMLAEAALAKLYYFRGIADDATPPSQIRKQMRTSQRGDF